MGKSSEVYLYGELIPEEKVQKETSRYRSSRGNREDRETQHLPDGVTMPKILVPPETFIPEEIQQFEPIEDLVATLPDIEGLRTLFTPIFMGNYSLPSLGHMNTSIFPSRSQSPLDRWFLSNIESPDRMLRDETSPVGNGFLSCFNIIAPLDTLSLVYGSNSQHFQVFQGLDIQIWKNIRPCIEKTILLLPEQGQQELRGKPHNVVFFSLLMFLLVNNFATENDVVFENLFQHLRQFSVSQIENLLNMIPYPYSIALEQSILTIAIKVGAVSVVHVLLDRGLDPNTVLCHIGNEHYVPLHLACKHQQIEIVRLLIDSGADVNKTRESRRPAIWYLFYDGFGRRKETQGISPVTRDILRMLLIAGAGVASYGLESSRFWKDKELVDIFLEYAAPLKQADLYYMSHTPLRIVLLNLDQDRATRAVKLLLGTEFMYGQMEVSNSAMEVLQDAAQLAAFQGNEDLVDIFLGAGVRPTGYWLVEAVRGNSIPTVRRLLREGVKATEVAHNTVQPYAGMLPKNVDSLLTDRSIQHLFTTPLAEAIRWKRKELCQIFLELGVLDKHNQFEGLEAALVAASEIGDLERVRYILQFAGRTISVPSGVFRPQSIRAIDLATIGNHETIIEELLEAGMKPNASSITAAILVRNLNLLRLFLDVGTPDVTIIRGRLSLAIRWGHIDAVRALIEAGASLHEIGWTIPFMDIGQSILAPSTTPLGEALARGDKKIIQLLLESGASASLEGFTTSGNVQSPLCVAVQSGNKSLVREVLARGAARYDPDALLAASLQSTEMMQILLQAFDSGFPSGLKFFGAVALHRAISDRAVARVRLLAKYTDVNDLELTRGNVENKNISFVQDNDKLLSPLGQAIASCNTEIVQIILEAGGKPNNTVATRAPYPHTGRWTALLAAVHTGQLAIVELICDAGANVNYAAELGATRTPLQLAVETGSLEIVQFLLTRDANVNGAPCIWGGGTALQLAAIKGYVGIAETLIQHGADINAPRGRFQGRTAFEGAAEHGRMDALLLLYHKGVDLVSDGGEQVRRAIELAEKNAQLGAKGLVEQLSLLLDTTFMI